ncbi:MAG: 2OG-Fe(II) oxygenase [Bryobacterales bacterium]|jgi:PKHD-type hydroxylase|nr:2OG-Fe(II) oxygenase [Bryobacterales bacterium]
MSYKVFRLLDHDKAEKILAVLDNARFVDGKITARGGASDVKLNLQTDGRDESLEPLDRTLRAALAGHGAFQAYTHPKAIQIPIYSRYEPGMTYGPHVDRAIMGELAHIRTDLSMTLFLSRPESYDGGELTIRSEIGEDPVKLDCGEAVVYPSTAIHYVAPVTRGVRVAAVTWIQSMFRDAAMREILWDMWSVLQRIPPSLDPELQLLMSKTYNNLIRHAAEL